MNGELLYGLLGDERLKASPEDVVERYLENISAYGESMEEVVERAHWPLKIHVFKRVEICENRVERIADGALENILESLDEDYSGIWATEPTETMKAAALTFLRAVVEEYIVWQCEPTGETIEFTKEHALKGFGDEK